MDTTTVLGQMDDALTEMLENGFTPGRIEAAPDVVEAMQNELRGFLVYGATKAEGTGGSWSYYRGIPVVVDPRLPPGELWVKP